MTIYQLISFFFLYGFLGWCTEVCFQALTKGKLVNRGFLNGAICPIYGIGVVLVVWLLEPLAPHGSILFAGALILCSLLEWLTGFILEKLFHQKWWDYSKEPFNIGGYVCLRFSLMWGLACVFVVYIIHPTISWLVSLVPHTLGLVILSILNAAFLLDCAATVKTMIGFNKELRRIDEGAAKLREVSDGITEELYEKSLKAKSEAEKVKEETAELKERAAEEAAELRLKAEREKAQLRLRTESEKRAVEEQLQKLQGDLERKLTRGQIRLLKAFPEMRSTKYKEAAGEMKRRLPEHRKQRQGPQCTVCNNALRISKTEESAAARRKNLLCSSAFSSS